MTQKIGTKRRNHQNEQRKKVRTKEFSQFYSSFVNYIFSLNEFWENKNAISKWKTGNCFRIMPNPYLLSVIIKIIICFISSSPKVHNYAAHNLQVAKIIFNVSQITAAYFWHSNRNKPVQNFKNPKTHIVFVSLSKTSYTPTSLIIFFVFWLGALNWIELNDVFIGNGREDKNWVKYHQPLNARR